MSENLYITFAVHISLISIFHIIKILFIFYKDIRFHKFSQPFTLSLKQFLDMLNTMNVKFDHHCLEVTSSDPCQFIWSSSHANMFLSDFIFLKWEIHKCCPQKLFQGCTRGLGKKVWYIYLWWEDQSNTMVT